MVRSETLHDIRGLKLTKNTFAPLLAALGAAVLATQASATPTGITIWDGALKFTVAFLVVIAASKAPRWALIVVAAVAAGAGGVTAWGLLGWAALILAAASALLGRRSRLLAALAAGLAVQSLLRLPPGGFFGLQSLIAGGCFVLICIAGYRYGTRRSRKLIRWAGVATGLSMIAMMLIGGTAVLGARSDVDRGVAAARRGLDAARAGDTTAVVSDLTIAESALTSAESRLSGRSGRLLRLVPIVSQHQRAMEAATAQGALVAREASAAVRDADIDQISLSAGAVDLSALQQMAPQLRSTSAALTEAVVVLGETDSPWLLPVVSNRVGELSDEIEGLLPETELAATAAEVVPEMLGVAGPQTYFVIFGTPAESREFGGFIGSWALLSFDNGRIAIGESGRINELYSVARASGITPGTVSDWFLEMGRPTEFPQNLTSSPDFVQVAEVSRQVLSGATDEPLAGFIYLDAWALIDLLELTGPVEIPFQEEPLTVQNAPQFFFVDQYRFGATGRTEIFDTLAQVAGTVLDRLSGQTLPGPEELGRILGPAARGGHMQVVTFDETHNDFLRSIHLLRDFGKSGEATDFVGLVQSNALSNKMDLYLERGLNYNVAVDQDGVLQATATATLRSAVPDDAPEFTLGAGETAGLNRVLLSLYSPNALTNVTLNGASLDFRSTTEFGLSRYLVDVTLPPTGDGFEIRFDLVGVVNVDLPYALEVWSQPLVNTDEVSVSYTGPSEEFTWSGSLDENLLLSADLVVGN